MPPRQRPLQPWLLAAHSPHRLEPLKTSEFGTWGSPRAGGCVQLHAGRTHMLHSCRPVMLIKPLMPKPSHMPHSCFMTASTARCPSEAPSAAATSALAACSAFATPLATSPVLCWSSQRLNWAGDRPERSHGVWMLAGNL
jgi:hypothetical protein